MPHRYRYRTFAALVLVLALPAAAAAAPLFTLTEDGRAFLYRARPGDHPSAVAEMFGIPSSDLERFLAANAIRDATRVGPGFVYRIPNPVSAAAEAVAADNVRLAREAAAAGAKVGALEQDAAQSRAEAATATARAERLGHLERWWPVAQAAVLLLALAAAGMAAFAMAAVRRQQRAERYARSLAQELEERRKGALAERQESGRRILELEERVRGLQAKLAPRVLIGGR